MCCMPSTRKQKEGPLVTWRHSHALSCSVTVIHVESDTESEVVQPTEVVLLGPVKRLRDAQASGAALAQHQAKRIKVKEEDRDDEADERKIAHISSSSSRRSTLDGSREYCMHRVKEAQCSRPQASTVLFHHYLLRMVMFPGHAVALS